MANTPMEAEKSGTPDGEPSYPFNLSMTLQQSDLDKLEADACDEDCQVGNYVHIHALAEIVGINKNDSGDGEKVTLNFQITHMCLENETAEDEEYDKNVGGSSPY